MFTVWQKNIIVSLATQEIKRVEKAIADTDDTPGAEKLDRQFLS